MIEHTHSEKYSSPRDPSTNSLKKPLVLPNRSRSLYLLLAGIVIGAFIFGVFHYLVTPTATGRASLNVETSYMNGETIAGMVRLLLKKGELLPIDTRVRVSLGNQTVEHTLGELTRSDISSGSFYAEGFSLRGEGEGYGLEGEHDFSPEVTFDLRVYSSDTSSPSENSPSTEESAPVSNETSSEGSTTADTSSDSSSPVSESSPMADDTSSEDPSFSEIGSESGGSLLTGNVISENERIIHGSVRKLEDFTHSLEEGEYARLVPGSVKIDDVAVDDSLISLAFSEQEVRVSTNYSEHATGFGEQFLENATGFVINVDLSQFDVVARNGVLHVDVFYEDNTFIALEGNISVEGDSSSVVENETSIENMSAIIGIINQTQEIPLIRVLKNNETSLDMDSYFSGATSYELVTRNISGSMDGTILHIVPDEDFAGSRRAIIRASVEGATLESNEFTILVSGSGMNLRTTRSQVRVGEPVLWKTNVTFDSPDNVTIELPAEAQNITIRTPEENETGGVPAITGNLVAEVRLQHEAPLVRWWKKIVYSVTGNAIEEDLDIAHQEDAVQVHVDDRATHYTIEYYTPGPETFEEDTARGKEVTVSAADDLGYTDVIASTSFSNTLHVVPSKLHLYWRNYESVPVEHKEVADVPEESIVSDMTTVRDESLTELPQEVLPSLIDNTPSVTGNVIGDGSEASLEPESNASISPRSSYILEEVPFDAYDLDEDGNIDYVEWVVPHLSNQTYEIILVTKADHLDENRTFISDIYPAVAAQDNNWSEEIPVGHFVRVTFEHNLTRQNDITIYARSNSTSFIAVYEQGGTQEIARFDSIQNESSYKVYLSGLAPGTTSSTFDLQIWNDSVSFDHIIDPADATAPNVSFVSPTFTNGSTQNAAAIYVNVSSADTSDHYTFTDFNHDVVFWMRMDDLNASGDPTDISTGGTNLSKSGNAHQNNSCYIGNCFSFDGNGDYLQSPTFSNALNLTRNFSFSFWINPRSLPGTAGVFRFGDTASTGAVNEQNQALITSAGIIRFAISDGSANDIADSANGVLIGNWTHVVITVNATTDLIYFQGGLNTSWIRTRVPQSGLSNFRFFIASRTTGTGFFDGKIDDFIVFNRTLTQTEVKALFNASAYKYSNNFTNLSYGNYTFTAYSVDTSANKNQTEQRTIQLTNVTVDPTLLTACGNLTLNNTVYTLTANLTNVVGTCFTILGNGITLNGSGNYVDGDAIGAGDAGILISANYSRILNVHVTDFAYGILSSSGSTNQNVSNVEINTSTEGIHSPAPNSIFTNISMKHLSSTAFNLDSASNSFVMNFSLQNTSGISMAGCFNCSVSFGLISASSTGIFLSELQNLTLTNISFSGTSGYDLDILYDNTEPQGISLIDTFPSNYTFHTSGASTTIRNFLLRRTGVGQILFLQPLGIVNGTNLTREAYTSFNFAEVNSSKGGWNISANITLYNTPGTGLTNPTILRNGVACPTGACYNFTALSASIVVFNVTGWTNYSLGEGIVTTLSACAVLTQANTVYTLTSDIIGASSPCFDITASNVTLNMSGYTITGDAMPSTIGVNIQPGMNNTRIVNGVIRDFEQGIYGLELTNVTIDRMAITSSGFFNDQDIDPLTGISLSLSQFITITNSRVENISTPLESDKNSASRHPIGFYITYSNYTRVENATFSNIHGNQDNDVAFGTGLIGYEVSQSVFSNINATDCGSTGVSVYLGTNVTLQHISVSNSLDTGIIFGSYVNATALDVTSFSNAGGVQLSDLNSSTVSGLQVRDSYNGLMISGSWPGTTLSNFSIVNTEGFGLALSSISAYGLVMNGTINSSGPAISLGSGSSLFNYTFSNITILPWNTTSYDLSLDPQGAGNWVNGPVFENMIIGRYLLGINVTLAVRKTGLGEIRFLQAVNMSGSNFSADIQIRQNFAQVNSSQTGLNVSANITLYNTPSTGLTNPALYRNGAACPSGVCYNFTALTAPTLVFNVTGWSNYSLGESTILQTCANLSSSNTVYVLKGDIPNGGTCFNITGSNVTLNGVSYLISYNGSQAISSTYYGVFIAPTASNVTLLNISILNYTTSFFAPTAGIFVGAPNTTIQNARINGSRRGIDLRTRDISLNTIALFNPTPGFGSGIVIGSGTVANVTVTNLTIVNVGVAIDGSANGGGSLFVNNFTIVNASNAISFDASFAGSAATFYKGSITGSRFDAIVLTDYIFGTLNFTNVSVTGTDSNYHDISFSNHDSPISDVVLANTFLQNYSFSDYGGYIRFIDSRYGAITFLSPVTGSGTNLTRDVYLSQNFAEVNSSQVGLNASANVTLYNSPGAGLVTPAILRNGGTCPSDQCSNYTALTAPTVVFSVSGWSNYSIGEATNITVCGPLTQANTVYTFTSNITTGSTCFTISANNITVDMNGYTLTGPQSSGSVNGFVIDGVNGTTIKNGRVASFGGIGVSSNNAWNGTFVNLTVASNSTEVTSSPVFGVYLSSGGSNILRTINVSNIANAHHACYGVLLSGSSHNTLIDIQANSLFNCTLSYGIYISDGQNNTIVNSTMNSNIGQTLAYGLFYDSSNGTITNISANSNHGIGVYLSTNAQANTFLNVYAYSNAIIEPIAPTGGIGLYVSSGHHNNFTNVRTISNEQYGILVQASDNLFVNSSLSSDASSVSILGSRNTFINGSVSTSNTAFLLQGQSYNTSLTNVSVTGTTDIRFSGGLNGTTFIDMPNLNAYDFGTVGGTMTFRKTGAGEIAFLQPVNGSGGNLVSDVFLASNFAEVNSTQTGLNRSANITLYNIATSAVQAAILRNGVTCPSNICYNFTSLTGNVSFNVTAWTNYSIGEGLNSCLGGTCSENGGCNITGRCLLYNDLCTGSMCDFTTLRLNGTIMTGLDSSGNGRNLTLNITSNATRAAALFINATINFSGGSGAIGGRGGVLSLNVPDLLNTSALFLVGKGGASSQASQNGGAGGSVQLSYHGLIRNFTDLDAGLPNNRPNVTGGAPGTGGVTGTTGGLTYVKSMTCPVDVDADGDGAVAIPDWQGLKIIYNSKMGDANYNANYDFNCDGIINVIDLTRIGLSGEYLIR